MKKLLALALAVGLAATVSISPTLAGWDPARAEEERKAAEETIAKFKEKDPSIQRFFDHAYGYLVFPSVGTGAFIVGAAHGTGLVYEKGVLVGKSNLTQGTVGLQAGGQSYREIIFFKDEAALNTLKERKLKLAAKASAIAVTAGAATTADYSEGVAIFTMGKGGLMVQAAVGGQELTFEPN